MAHAASGPAGAGAPFACISHLDDRVAWLPYRRRWPRPASHFPARHGWGLIGAPMANARRWGAIGVFRLASSILLGAIGVFRLASSILRCAMILHRQRRISRRGLQNALSATRLLERARALLALGRRRRKHQEVEKDFHRERAESLFAGEKRILEMVATGGSLAEILERLCRLLEET